jgi:CBS domain-containing protein/uncharacterized protein (DUF2267 family)
MSLEKYTRTRLVVQRPSTSLYDAIRAMEDNHVGCVLVQDGANVALVTDRDIALEVVAFQLDPFETELQDVISTHASVLPVTASVRDAAALMLDRHVRRIPIVDQGRLVGIVTLDDLILDQAVDGATLASIVRAQLSEPARLKRRGLPRPTRRPADDEASRERNLRRHAARARASYDSLIERARAITGLDMPERAMLALQTVLSAIAHRIRPEEAEHLLAQLPSLLRDRIASLGTTPDRSVTRKAIEEALAARLDVEQHCAEELLRRVGLVLVQSISPGELADVRAQLPPDLKDLLEAPASSARPVAGSSG